jgi:hypothetical protein
MVLACRKCNSEKDNIFPYFNIEGIEVKPKKLFGSTLFTLQEGEYREEWKQFLYME